jgi:ABC-type uncharacterized transport system permease subunit
MAFLMGFFAITLGVNQHVAGLGITLLCTSLSLFSFRMVFGESQVLPKVEPFGQVSLFGNLPILGPIFQQYWLTYIAFLVLIPLAWWLLYCAPSAKIPKRQMPLESAFFAHGISPWSSAARSWLWAVLFCRLPS